MTDPAFVSTIAALALLAAFGAGLVAGGRIRDGQARRRTRRADRSVDEWRASLAASICWCRQSPCACQAGPPPPPHPAPWFNPGLTERERADIRAAAARRGYHVAGFQPNGDIWTR